MSIKVSTGSKKGVTLSSSKSVRELRPTQSLVREAIINILYGGSFDFDFEESDCLDLYAGIGTVGIEFLSNNAKMVIFVEKNRNCVKAIKTNLIKLDYHKRGKTLTKPVLEALKYLGGQKKYYFNLIFADAPYKDNDFEKVVNLILEKNLLKSGGILIWECTDKSPQTLINKGVLPGLNLIKEKNYGDTFIYFLQLD